MSIPRPAPFHARVIRRRATRSGRKPQLPSWRWEVRLYRDRQLLSLSGASSHPIAMMRAHALVTRLNAQWTDWRDNP